MGEEARSPGEGPFLCPEPQPASGRGAAEEEGVRVQGGAAAERARPAAGRMREARDAGAAATHPAGAGAKEPQSPAGEENLLHHHHPG